MGVVSLNNDHRVVGIAWEVTDGADRVVSVHAIGHSGSFRAYVTQ